MDVCVNRSLVLEKSDCNFKNKMVGILQASFSNVFPCLKIFEWWIELPLNWSSSARGLTVNPSLNPQRVSYGMSLVTNFQKADHVLTTPLCIGLAPNRHMATTWTGHGILSSNIYEKYQRFIYSVLFPHWSSACNFHISNNIADTIVLKLFM